MKKLKMGMMKTNPLTRERSSADLEVQLVQLNHYDGVLSN